MIKKISLAIVSGLLLGACLHTPTTTQPQTAPETETEVMEESMEKVEGPVITIQNFKHSPSTLTVAPGETVTVSNLDITGHTVTSDDETSFDTGIVSQGQTVTFTAPEEPGEYPFHCIPHPNMMGTLIVEG
jgi:plastocyanin